jgi:DNA repair protein RadA/Sms
MAGKKSKVQYICNECGTSHPKWIGKCEGCGEWNTLSQEKLNIIPTFGRRSNDNLHHKVEILDIDYQPQNIIRIDTGIGEFNRVLGDGLVRGSAILLGGDPGIGKSTLLLQTVITLSNKGVNTLYISGEESAQQISLRANRLNVKTQNAKLAIATSLDEIISVINELPNTEVIVIDSIQTIYNETIESAPGTVTQVRACAFELIRIAKQKNIAVIFVGHVTKEGNIAGPKVLEHMVDAVLYFEGERGHQFRIIRAVKNRFGAANEIGVFEMTESGLNEVTNPSALFLPNRETPISGSCIFAGMEGTRPVLLEVQALVVPSFLATPRRAVIGWDVNRLAMLIAVLNSRFGINLFDKEVYLNVTGGLKITEPAADLAVVAALLSAAKDIPIDSSNVFFGEVGLSGEIRQISHAETRLQEAYKLGFEKAFMPAGAKNSSCNIEKISLNHINMLSSIFKK